MPLSLIHYSDTRCWAEPMWLSIDAGPSLEICSGRMLLQQAPTCGAQRQLTTRFWKKKNHQLFPLNASILAPYISDIQCLKYAASWMQLCLKNHTQCNNSVYGFNSTDILKRFIRVGNGQASVLLRNETHQDERVRYMTVGHIGGQGPVPKLLQSNIH
jgi:hypothetical protein